MNTRRILILSVLCLSLGTTQAPAQGFLNKLKNKGTQLLKNAAPKPVKKVLNEVEDVKATARQGKQKVARQQQKAEDIRVRSFQPATKTITVKFCEGVGRKEWYGRVGGVSPMPPAECPKQPAWIDALPELWHMDNARLVAEHEMLEKWMKQGKPACEPVLVRRELNGSELSDRIGALDKVVKEIHNDIPEEAEFLSAALEADGFKHAVNSDWAPLYKYLEKETVDYLKSIDRKTKTLDVKVYEGNSSDAVKVQVGEMWFKVNSARQDAVLECLDQDLSIGKDYTVPSTITYSGRTFKVTEIGATAFADLKIKSVTLSPGLKVIGDQAFTRTRISSIPIPSTVTEINNRAFAEIPTLKTITIPNSVRKLGLGLFTLCTGLTSAKLPDTVDNMGNTVFWLCSSLTQVTLPQNLTKLPQSTFEDCKALTHVDLPNSITVIDQNAFKHTGLTSVPVPASLTKIKCNAFEGCSKLTSVSLPARVELDFMSFKDCKALKKVAIGKQYKDDPSALYGAFMGCSFVNPRMTKAPACVTFTE